MDTPSKSKLHPVLWIAAVSVTVLSLAGVGAITGLIPTVGSKSGEPMPPTATGTPATATAAAPATAEPTPAEAPKPAAKHHPAHPAPLAQNAAPQPAVAPPVCRDCGTIEGVRAFEVKGEGTGLGAVGGAVVGGLLGSTVGKGHGKDAATIVGAVGGGFAGNAIEKNVRKKTRYEIVVRFDDGTTKSYTQEAQPSWRNGDRVRVVDGHISALN